MEYWTIINDSQKKSSNKELTQIISMERLNNARVQLKHYGNSPSKSVITDDYRVSTQNFFEENTKIIFGLNFSDISLFDIIVYPNTRNDLKKRKKLRARIDWKTP